jgi:hypothetical protein
LTGTDHDLLVFHLRNLFVHLGDWPIHKFNKRHWRFITRAIAAL